MLKETTSTQGPSLYTDAEVQQGTQELFGNEAFVRGMKNFLPIELAEKFIQASTSVTSSYDFQRDIVHPLLQLLKKNSLTDLSCSGLEGLNKNQKYLFISNHRDIGLDSAFMNLLLFDNGFTTTQIAIGDNLVKHRIAELIFRINKSFIVQRSGGPRELYSSSVALSDYIKRMVVSGTDSIWIAQREGRAKDGNDLTQVSLLKMLAMSADKHEVAEHFQSLNVVPVSIAYEYNPCDYFLTKEFIERSENPDYKKTFEDDMAAILQGLKGQKGQVHISFGSPIDTRAFSESKNAKELLKTLASEIDRQIHSSYHLTPISYYSLDQLNESKDYLQQYKTQESALQDYFQRIVDKFSADRQKKARQNLLNMYANPLMNKLSCGKS